MNPQGKLDSKMFKSHLEFGGSLMKRSKYQTDRPISSQDTMHVILKSTKARGQFSFGYKKNPIVIKSLSDKHCAKYGVKSVRYSNNFNHLHMHVKFGSRAIYLKFIRPLTGSLGQ